MRNVLKTACKGVISLSIIAVATVCFAATDASRGTATTNRGRGTAASRMPSIPILPVSGVGNMTVSNDDINPTPNPNPNPNPPTPDPDPEPDPDTPVPPTPPTPPSPPQTNCADGGVENSSYTVENCMNDVLGCVNGGALPNGINSLFNEDLRNSIVNGMGLCLTHVEKCITTVRRNCQYVYASASDVWLDFNARKVQPEYYSFVLRQTGLTPTQAENTCLLLDRNTYGAAFNAVSVSDQVTSEYNQRVGAYNSAQNDSLSKQNPLGAKINNTGIDGKRGYYARWDAENAQCLLRVAAYNKDTPITNSWLFGAIGDETPAEVWRATGSSFTCNKDLFGFSLMNDTKTAAVVGIGGGTVLGAGIGALAGHGDRKFDCTDESMRNTLLKQLQENKSLALLNMYISSDVAMTAKTMTLAQCRQIMEVYELWLKGNEEIKKCTPTAEKMVRVDMTMFQYTCEMKSSTSTEYANRTEALQDIADQTDEICAEVPHMCAAIASNTELFFQNLDPIGCKRQDIINSITKWCTDNRSICKADGSSVPDFTGESDHCRFIQLNEDRRDGTGVHCDGGPDCIGKAEFQTELNTLAGIFDNLKILDGEKSNRLKTTLIGAGIGAATGGTATAITAFVEKNNINCRVADGLARVSFGKSYTIDRLRDFYVKWALKLPSTIAPTAVVTNCDNWQLTCALFTDAKECRNAQFNYRPGNLSSTTLITSPCTPSGSACIANLGVAQSNGECLVTPTPNPNPNPDPNADLARVSDCDQWIDACKVFTTEASCNAAKVIYVPQSMRVSNACKYQTRINECRPSAQKAKQYLDINNCPIRLE